MAHAARRHQMIGSDLVARAPSDGHALLLGTIGSLAIKPV